MLLTEPVAPGLETREPRLIVAKLDGTALEMFEMRGNLLFQESLIDGYIVVQTDGNPPLFKRFPEGTVFEVL